MLKLPTSNVCRCRNTHCLPFVQRCVRSGCPSWQLAIQAHASWLSKKPSCTKILLTVRITYSRKGMLFWECRESPVDLHIIMNLVHENQQSLFRGLRVAGNYTKMNAHWRALIAHWLFTHLLLVVSSHARQPCLWLTRLYCGQVSLNIICHNLWEKIIMFGFLLSASVYRVTSKVPRLLIAAHL